MKEKGRHSRESGNPGNLKKNKKLEITQYFSTTGPAWMPASAGMTNYDTVSVGERERVRGEEPFSWFAGDVSVMENSLKSESCQMKRAKFRGK
jgi:hypothetical protein